MKIMKFFLVLIFSFVLLNVSFAQSQVELVAPSDVFLLQNREGNFRVFIRNTGDNPVNVSLILEGYVDGATFWAAQQRNFDNFTLNESNKRMIEITGLKPHSAGEVFVLLIPVSDGQLTIKCYWDTGNQYDSKNVAITVGEPVSFSVLNPFALMILIVLSVLVFLRIAGGGFEPPTSGL